MPSASRRRAAPDAAATVGAATFAGRLLRWFDAHGRKDLPWQRPRTPYRVWLSEVMLQQTQVATVVPYFKRFVRELPELRALAAAHADCVLALWAGLGYYSRARNLHRAAQLCVEHHGGELPTSLEELSALPGIGRSTAGAILAQAHGLRVPILDGNVRRVLARHAGIGGDPQSPVVQRDLWARAESLLPRARMADYTQAIMDLGATVCRGSAPDCAACPLASDCVARREDRIDELPGRKARRATPRRETRMLVLRDDRGQVFLQRRPPLGIWGGLWSLPECAPDAAVAELVAHDYGLRALRTAALPAFEHRFTHFRLQVTPVRVDIRRPRARVEDRDDRRWVGGAELDTLGLPQPVRRLLDGLIKEWS